MRYLFIIISLGGWYRNSGRSYDSTNIIKFTKFAKFQTLHFSIGSHSFYERQLTCQTLIVSRGLSVSHNIAHCQKDWEKQTYSKHRVVYKNKLADGDQNCIVKVLVEMP